MFFVQGCETKQEKLEGEIGLAVLVAAYDLAAATDHSSMEVLKAFRGNEQALFERIEECGIEPFSSLKFMK